jgi:hypothetical protein
MSQILNNVKTRPVVYLGVSMRGVLLCIELERLKEMALRHVLTGKEKQAVSYWK